MGTKNRERRRHKQLQRDRQRRRRADAGRADPGPGFLPPELLLGPVIEAVHHGEPDADELLGAFTSSPFVEGGSAAVASCLRRRCPPRSPLAGTEAGRPGTSYGPPGAASARALRRCPARRCVPS